MTPAVTIEEALAKLAALGSPEQIAVHLADLGIRAARRCPDACAVAVYLLRVTDAPAVSCTRNYAYDYLDGQGDGRGEPTPLPHAVREFIIAFDAGAHPELERR